MESELNCGLDIGRQGRGKWRSRAQGHARIGPNTPDMPGIVTHRYTELAVELFDGNLVLPVLQFQLDDLPLIFLDRGRQRDAQVFELLDASQGFAALLQALLEKVGLRLGAGKLKVPFQGRACCLIAAFQRAIEQHRFLEGPLFRLLFGFADVPAGRSGLLFFELPALAIEAVSRRSVFGGETLAQHRSDDTVGVGRE